MFLKALKKSFKYISNEIIYIISFIRNKLKSKLKVLGIIGLDRKFYFFPNLPYSRKK